MTRTISFCIVSALMLSISLGEALGQLAWEGAYWDQIDRAKGFPMAVQVWADALQDRSREQGHCDSLNLAHAVLISLGNLERSDKPLDAMMTTLPGCDTMGYVTWYSIGVHHYLNKRLFDAKRAFEQSLRFNPQTSRQVSTLHAIGTLANQLGDLEGAYAAYKTAYELEPESDNPLRLSNLATMNMTLKDYATALDWLKLAEEAWNDKTEEMEQRLPQDFGEVILRNRLLCTYELGLWEAAASTFNRLKPGPFEGQDPASGAAIVLNYLLRTDNFDVFSRMHEDFESAFRQDSARSVPMLGLAAELFSPWARADEPLADAWQRVRSMPTWAWHNPWPGMSAKKQKVDPELRPEQLGLDDRQRPWSPVSWGTMALLALGGFWRGRVAQQKRREQRQAEAEHHRLSAGIERLEQLQEEIRKNPKDVELQALPWPVGINTQSTASFAKLGESLPQWSSLTEREKETLFWSLQGEGPEQIAQRLGCKRSHVYNLRTRLRTKLKIGNAQDWLEWWRSRLPIFLMCFAMASGTKAQQADWSQEMSTLLDMPMDRLVAQPTEHTTAFPPLENWIYHGYVAICDGNPARLQGLPRIDTASIPMVHKWLNPLVVTTDSAAFSTWRLAAPRVQGALRSAIGDMDADGFTTLKTEAWVVEGTPRERQWALLRKAQWLLFLTVAAGLVGLGWKERRRSQQGGLETNEGPSVAAQEGVLTSTNIDLSQAEVEACIGKSRPSAPEVRAAVHALEMLTLPWLEKKAVAKGTLPAVWAELTQKERQVALLLARRVPPQQIAEILRCSPAYVYNMKSELRKKWGLADSTELDRALLRLI